MVALARSPACAPSRAAAHSSPRAEAAARRAPNYDRPSSPARDRACVQAASQRLHLPQEHRRDRATALSASRFFNKAGCSRSSRAPGPKGSTTRPKSASSDAASASRRTAASSISTTAGMSRTCRCDPARGARGLHPLIDEALMRRMLIDDDDAVARLGDDIGLVDLRPRRTERRFHRLGRGRLACARVSALGARPAKARLRLGDAGIGDGRLRRPIAPAADAASRQSRCLAGAPAYRAPPRHCSASRDAARLPASASPRRRRGRGRGPDRGTALPPSPDAR